MLTSKITGRGPRRRKASPCGLVPSGSGSLGQDCTGLPPVPSSRRLGCTATISVLACTAAAGARVPCRCHGARHWAVLSGSSWGTRRAVMGRGERTRAVIGASLSGPGAPSTPLCPGPARTPNFRLWPDSEDVRTERNEGNFWLILISPWVPTDGRGPGQISGWVPNEHKL